MAATVDFITTPHKNGGLWFLVPEVQPASMDASLGTSSALAAIVSVAEEKKNDD